MLITIISSRLSLTPKKGTQPLHRRRYVGTYILCSNYGISDPKVDSLCFPQSRKKTEPLLRVEAISENGWLVLGKRRERRVAFLVNWTAASEGKGLSLYPTTNYVAVGIFPISIHCLAVRNGWTDGRRRMQNSCTSQDYVRAWGFAIMYELLSFWLSSVWFGELFAGRNLMLLSRMEFLALKSDCEEIVYANEA